MLRSGRAIDLSRKTLRKIWQNLGYNVLLIPVAAGALVLVPVFGGPVLLHPMLAAMALSSVNVGLVMNSTLLGRWGKHKAPGAGSRWGSRIVPPRGAQTDDHRRSRRFNVDGKT